MRKKKRWHKAMSDGQVRARKDSEKQRAINRGLMLKNSRPASAREKMFKRVEGINWFWAIVWAASWVPLWSMVAAVIAFVVFTIYSAVSTIVSRHLLLEFAIDMIKIFGAIAGIIVTFIAISTLNDYSKRKMRRL